YKTLGRELVGKVPRVIPDDPPPPAPEVAAAKFGRAPPPPPAINVKSMKLASGGAAKGIQWLVLFAAKPGIQISLRPTR
ncbi:hypothetical protein U2441_15680, partial [Listeria monocytogenes]|uniref:hypothetical protein n=1 Tax=Listeria monocytogenes TaxID=1639 RepID=UPI002FDBFC9D